MIRKALPEELDYISRLWLEVSIESHDFVPRKFWEDNLAAIRNEYLPAAETWVIKEREDEHTGHDELVMSWES
ncbi:hypothetical protein [Maridesulfovibrio sp.]|uniref:hypothetical protein n=1 Tax=Maridesulfovibrio sp. TaxID=2795000 RepID=UPI0029C9C0B5|nr:hypothetical protein [Maridesulfovibrio sp.]